MCTANFFKCGRVCGCSQDKEHCDISRLKISPLISKHSATKPVEILKRSTARKNKVIIMFPGLVSVVQVCYHTKIRVTYGYTYLYKHV
jgi:hypothetical protein